MLLYGTVFTDGQRCYKHDSKTMIKPKRDRKKKIIPGKYEVYGKRGNYVFTAYDYWNQKQNF